MALSTNTFTFAGGAQTFTLSLAFGYLKESDIRVFVVGEVDGGGDQIYRAFTFDSEFVVRVTDPLTIGDNVTAERTVSKTTFEVDFETGGDITGRNMMILYKQVFMAQQELLDGRVLEVDFAAIAAEVSASADAAFTSATGADASETAAAISETNAGVSASAAAADAVATGDDAVQTAADLVATDADQIAAAASAAAAAISEGNASTSESNAATSASNASTSESNAETSATNAAASYDSFDDRFLGAKASAPTLDNDGNALLTGAIYWDTTATAMFAYSGTAWKTWGTQGRQTIWFNKGDITPRNPAGASDGSFKAATNNVMVETWDFDPSGTEYVQFAFTMPKKWNRGNVTAQVLWSHSDTTVNFGTQFKIQGLAIRDGDLIGAVWGVQKALDDTGGITDTLYITPVSAEFAVSGTPQPEDHIIFRIQRNVGNAFDDLAVDARIHGILIHIVTDASTDD